MPPKTPRKRNGFATLAAKTQKILRPSAAAPGKRPELPYPRSLLQAAEARAGFVAVYIVAPRQQGWPISFGVTSNPEATYHSYQKGWWEEHALHELLWTPGRPAAERIKRGMVDMLQRHRKFFWRGWYDVTVDEAKLALLAVARQSGVSLFDDVEKHRRLHQIALKAWEMKVGVDRIETLPGPPEAASSASPSAVVIPLKRPRK